MPPPLEKKLVFKQKKFIEGLPKYLFSSATTSSPNVRNIQLDNTKLNQEQDCIKSDLLNNHITLIFSNVCSKCLKHMDDNKLARQVL